MAVWDICVCVFFLGGDFNDFYLNILLLHWEVESIVLQRLVFSFWLQLCELG